MSDKKNQTQIDELNSKLDLILEEMAAQRNARIERNDLVNDLSLVGKDVFSTTVDSLDKAGVELDTEMLGSLMIKIVRNISTFNQLMDSLESANDFIKDASPIINQVGLDVLSKFSELEQKGYLEVLKELGKLSDVFVQNISIDDIKMLSDSIPSILNLVKNVTKPEVMNALNKTVVAFSDLQNEKIPQYSLWKVFRKMQKPEMKTAMGFMMLFADKLSAADK